jgi:hypothetical protein
LELGCGGEIHGGRAAPQFQPHALVGLFRILLPRNRVFVRLVLIRLSFGHFELPKCAARHSNRSKSQETRVKANRLRYPSKQAIAKDSSKPNAGLHRAL